MFKYIAVIILVSWVLAARAKASETEVLLDTHTGRLSGTLSMPSGGPPAWIVLIIAGSGPTDRDGNTPAGKNGSLRLLADSLAQAGMASLRYDKRGVGRSSGAIQAEDNLRFETFVSDAEDWIDFLRSQKNGASIAVLGHSEGALIGMLAAKSRRPEAFISVAGPGRKASEVLRKQVVGHLPSELASLSSEILASLESGRLVSNVPDALNGLYRSSVQPYLISWFRHIPSEVIRNLDVPILLVQGTDDVQVGLDELELLAKAKPVAHRVVIAGMNHLLKQTGHDDSAQIASYTNERLAIAPTLVPNIARFLKKLPATPQRGAAQRGSHSAK